MKLLSNKERQEIKQRLDNLNKIEELVDVSCFQWWSNEAIWEVMKMVKSTKNKLLMQAWRINKLEDIIYRNGGVDTCDVICTALQTFLKADRYDPITAKKIT